MDSTDQTIKAVLTTLESGYRTLGVVRGRVLLAISGGADSLALLLGSVRLAGPLGMSFEVACLDHGLRPGTEAEVTAVRALVARLGLPFHTRALSLRGGPAIEERARQARYAALEEIRVGRGLEWIATAHTANDQAETLLMRLARGTSLKGAAGVLPRRGCVIRPMLDCTRGEVEAFLNAFGQDYARDPMNEDRAFLRPRIRKEVLPALIEAAGPSAPRHLAAYAELAREDDAFLSTLAEEAYRRLQIGPGALDAVGVRALIPPLRRRVIARLLAERSLPVDLLQVRRILEALERGGRTGLARGWTLSCAGGVVRCMEPRPPCTPAANLSLGMEETVDDVASGLRLGLTRRRPEGVPYVEVDTSIRPPLTVRRRLPGDRVAAGPRGKSRKLQDLLVDRRVRAEERDRIPVVVDREGRVLWVVGVWQARPREPSGLYLFAQLHDS